MHVNAVQNALLLRQIGASEWEAGTDGTGVHVAANLQLVAHLWCGCVQALLLLRRRNFTKYQLLPKDRFDFVLHKIQLVHTICVQRDVQSVTEESF